MAGESGRRAEPINHHRKLPRVLHPRAVVGGNIGIDLHACWQAQMMYLDEGVQQDFAAGLPVLLADMDDVGFGFDFDATTAGGFHFDTTTATTTTTCAAGASSGTSSPAGASLATQQADDGEEERLRRLKRKAANRDSARRSRARRRQRAEELGLAAEALQAEQRALAARAGAAAARALAVRLDNARLQAEARALRRRLGDAQRQAVLLLALARARLARSGAGVRGAAGVPPRVAGGVVRGTMM